MNAKRIVRWGIVLFLLVALPGMTVALAQGQEPAAKAPLPEVTEPGESLAPEAWDYYEVEGNNTRATADGMAVGYVMGGKINYVGDIDYFKISNLPFSEYLLLDIDAWVIGSNLDAVVCLQDSGGNTIVCNDDSDTLDSLLFHTTAENVDYYITVADYNNAHGGNDQYYELIVSTPLLVSAAPANLGTGNVAGIPFQSGDVLAWCDLVYQPDKWLMFFDASDVGVKTLGNVAVDNYGDHMLFSVGAAQTLPGLGTVKPHDILYFDPISNGYDQYSYGGNTYGTMGMYYRGSYNGLTTTAEKLDALDGWAGACGGYPVSTTGLATYINGIFYTTMKQDDEDVFCLNYNWGGYWNWWFDVDGANDGPYKRIVTGMPVEDVIGVANIDSYDRFALTILGPGKIFGRAVNQKDIFSIYQSTFGWAGFLWKGPMNGWNYNLDAFEMSDYPHLYSFGPAANGGEEYER